MTVFLWIVSKLLLRGGYRAITLWPFVFLADRSLNGNSRLMRHERIHLRQQAELAVILFYIIYVYDYLMGRIKGLDHDRAYRNIRFEREAFQNENDPGYLMSRKTWAVFRKSC
jgi:hypothetical protein